MNCSFCLKKSFGFPVCQNCAPKEMGIALQKLKTGKVGGFNIIPSATLGRPESDLPEIQVHFFEGEIPQVAFKIQIPLGGGTPKTQIAKGFFKGVAPGISKKALVKEKQKEFLEALFKKN